MLDVKSEESKVYGNDNVVELLEGWLELAREGKMCHVTLIGHELPNKMAFEAAGIVDVETSIPLAFDLMKIKMWEASRLRTALPERGLTADYVQYNLGNSPTSYDFLIWLINAEMTRVREGAPAPLKLSFTRGQTGDKGLATNYNQAVYANLMLPLLPMLNVQLVDYCGGRQDRNFLSKDIVEAVRRGEQVPKIVPPEKSLKFVDDILKGREPITITLREMDVWKHRNSNLNAWLQFAKALETRGEFVVIVRDTCKSNEPLKDFFTFPLASVNLQIRQALYERAKLNMFVPNGPYNLALFGTKPWLCFNSVDEYDDYHWNRPSIWAEHLGVSVGEQYPWSTPLQRLTWTADTYRNICDAYNAIRPSIEELKKCQLPGTANPKVDGNPHLP